MFTVRLAPNEASDSLLKEVWTWFDFIIPFVVSHISICYDRAAQSSNVIQGLDRASGLVA